MVLNGVFVESIDSQSNLIDILGLSYSPDSVVSVSIL